MGGTRRSSTRFLVPAMAVVLLSAPSCADIDGYFRIPLIRAAPGNVSELPTPLEYSMRLNGRSFVQNNLWTHGNVQYAIWVDAALNPIIGMRQSRDREWVFFDLSTLPGNPLVSPTERDQHNAYSLGIDGSGYIHVAGNMHVDQLRYVRSAEPGDIRSWVAGGMTGRDESEVTYPTFVKRTGGELLFFYRDGRSGFGNIIVNLFDESTRTWSRLSTLIDGKSSGESPYLQHVAVDSRGALHLIYVWRSAREPNSNSDISYARSPDGGRTWERSDGAVLDQPITHASSEVIVDTAAYGSGLLNGGGLEVTRSGSPHGAFVFRKGDGWQVSHVWLDRDGWHNEAIGPFASDGTRPAVLTRGEEVFFLATRPSGRRVNVALLKVIGGSVESRFVLMKIDVPGWEPTYDPQALVESGALSMIVPLEGGSSGEGAVATFDLSSVAASPADRDAI